ncbi:hypothetical protein, partial [Neisseria gonorrhoeae]|uniref:hypothetical protein n=1 Tax=Neisseria gonorrhoeae TaxID=485 RepID=UPI0027D2F125
MQHKPLPYQWGKFRNNTIKPEKQAMFFNSICQCIRFQHVSRMKMYGGLTKIRTRRRAAGSTDSTEPIRPALHHLRESFPLSRGGATPYRFLLIRYITDNAKTPAKPQQRLTCQETRFTCGFA